jgi:hypothetical protein
MSYAQLAQHGFVFPQPGYDLFTVHIPTFSLTRPNNTRWSATLSSGLRRNGETVW